MPQTYWFLAFICHSDKSDGLWHNGSTFIVTRNGRTSTVEVFSTTLWIARSHPLRSGLWCMVSSSITILATPPLPQSHSVSAWISICLYVCLCVHATRYWLSVHEASETGVVGMYENDNLAYLPENEALVKSLSAELHQHWPKAAA